MRLSIKLIFLLVTLFAFLELSNAVPKGRGGGGGGRGGKLKLWGFSVSRFDYNGD